jgi:aspartate/methionine/tyrosine aminotransferase
MPKLSKRIQEIEPSGIRKIFELATTSGKDFLDLSIGQPDFPAPAGLVDAGIEALRDGFSKYAPTKGLCGLRELIADKLKNKNGISAKKEEIIVTAGTSAGIFLAMSALLDPGDEVIIPDPYFVLYLETAKFLGAKPVFLDTYPDFRINPKKIASLIGPRTKLLILNSPNNPTGAVYSREELEAIAEILENKDIAVISDEIYEDFDYDGKFASFGSIYPKTITLNGFSKNYAVPGWRIGYAHADEEIIDAMARLKMYTFISAPTPAQAALARAGEIDNKKEVSAYKAKRDYVNNRLRGKFEIAEPGGAFYFFIKYPESRPDFSDELLGAGVLVVPGDVFSQRAGYFRLSFAVPDDVLKHGLEKIVTVLDKK